MSDTKPSLTDWTVFVVDDEPDSREIVYYILTQYGAKVFCVADAAAFEALWEQAQPTLIVLDLAMPKVDGWQLLDRIRAKPERAHIPVVAMSAHDSARVRVDALRAGFATIIPKPLRSAQFVQALQDVVNDSE